MITPAYSPTATERVLPRMALDFTTGVLDPRVTVTRALNTATRVNSSGYVESINANLPRFDYDPITLAPKGLLIEEARTNLFLQSQTFEIASWVKILSTISSNAANGPDNALTADKLIPNSGATFGGTYTFQQITKAASAITYTCSVFAKPDGFNYILLRCQDSGGAVNRANVTVDVTTGVIVTAAATAGGFSNASAKVTPFANGFFRVELTFTSSADTALRSIVFPTDSGGTVGDGVKGVLLYGAQLEAGAFATSYIPTTTTSLTRNADVVSMTGTNFSDWYNASEGTFVARAASLTTSAATRSLFDVRSATTIRMSLANFGTAASFAVVDTTTQASLEGTTAVTENTFFQIAGGYKANDFGCAANGGAAVTDTSGTVPAANIAWIGGVNGTSVRNGWVSNIWYYPQKLTSAEISAFSKQG
jgi:hypothetical protein